MKATLLVPLALAVTTTLGFSRGGGGGEFRGGGGEFREGGFREDRVEDGGFTGEAPRFDGGFDPAVRDDANIERTGDDSFRINDGLRIARKLLLELFEGMGPAHPLTAAGRRRLSSVLFS